MKFLRLSIMMFLQFFVWGAWFATLGLILANNNLDIGAGGLSIFGILSWGAFGTAPVAAILAPLFLGLVADRFFPSQIVMGVLFLLGGLFMYLAFMTASGLTPELAAELTPEQFTAGKTKLLLLMTAHMLCYMPTLGLANTVVFKHLDAIQFPSVRVWGTIGWIAAGMLGGFMGWSDSLLMLQVAAIASLALGLFSFLLPHTPAPLAGKPINLRALFMVDAFKLLLKPAFFVFMLCSCLICIPLACYYALTPVYLQNTGFTAAASTMTLGQISEIFFMLLIPFFFRKFGVKWMILIGMGCWVLRYLLFAVGAPDQTAWMIFLGILLHGICYDFFFVTGFMYTEKKAPPEIRGQAQSMLVFFTQGIGMYVGFLVAFGGVKSLLKEGVIGKLGFAQEAGVLAKSGAIGGEGTLQANIKSLRPEEEMDFVDSLKRMFNVDMPEQVDPALLRETMGLWERYWIYPAALAAAIALIFFLLFWDKVSVEEEG